jgi:LacI family transcriptional regulator
VIALGALDAARRRQVAVPGELSIVGFDDISLAGWESFRLTTVRQPIAHMAHEAARALVARIGGDDAPPRRVVFPTELIQRATTGAVAQPGKGAGRRSSRSRTAPTTPGASSA